MDTWPRATRSGAEGRQPIEPGGFAAAQFEGPGADGWGLRGSRPGLVSPGFGWSRANRSMRHTLIEEVAAPPPRYDDGAAGGWRTFGG